MNEEWRDIPDFPNYQVSNLGRVKSYKYNEEKVLKPRIGKRKGDEYAKVALYKDNKAHNIGVHRLVAFAFLPNPDNKPQIDHIDQNKLNNNISNLQWATSSENNLNKGNIFIGTNTGEPYISYDKCGNRYRVEKTKQYVTILKYFSNLEEAIQFRDSIIVP